MASLNRILSNLERLPVFPVVAARAMHMLNSPEASLASLEELILQDPGLSSAILRASNSAMVGVPGRIVGLRQGLGRLGTTRAIRVVAEQAVGSLLSGFGASYGLGAKDLWQAAVFGAVSAELIARRSGVVEPNEAYMAALLRDIGKIAVDCSWEARSRLAWTDGPSIVDEQQSFGTDHAALGAALAERWLLPPAIIESIRHHHDPASATNHRPLVDCVHAADILCMGVGFGTGDDGLRYVLDARVRATHLPSALVAAELTAQAWELALQVIPDLGAAQGDAA